MKKNFQTVSITTLGCKVNQFESAAFATGFADEGCKIISENNKNINTDIVVINTCAVTGKAGAESRRTIRKALKLNPEARIVVTGCYAQIDSQKILEITDDNAIVIGNGNKDLLVETTLSTLADDITMLTGNILEKKDICKLSVKKFTNRTRAFLRIQDGCNSFCSYCIVPYSRGPSRSLPINDITKQAKIFAEEGYREIVLTGIHIGQYGLDLSEEYNIVKAIEHLCKLTPDIRYRLSSIEPMEIDESLLSLMADQPNFMPHLHIPLQSGDDNILKKMNRRYTANQFVKVIELCKNKLPEVGIGIDVLTGFPGETDDHFLNTAKLIKEIDCSYLHVFPYSKRPGTPAASFKNQIPKNKKNERVSILRSIGEQKKKDFIDANDGKTRSVLIEQTSKQGGLLKGFTDNYISVSIQGDKSLLNTIVETKIFKHLKS